MKKLALASFWVFTSLLGLLFAIGLAAILQLHLPLVATLVSAGGFALLIAGLQYMIGPFLLDWIVTVVWCDPTSVDRDFARWYRTTCQTFGIREPRFGIIEDGAPNAFTYGHGAYDARVVITRGVVDMLSPLELRSVVAHELGHVKHRDFIVMTVVQGLVLAIYSLYVAVKHSSYRYSSGVLVLASWLAYQISYYISLYLSRVREYMADYASAQIMATGNHLSLALVKICYGLAHSKPAQDAMPSPSYARPTRGPNDPLAQGSPVAFTSQASNTQNADPMDTLVAAAKGGRGASDIFGPQGTERQRFTLDGRSLGAFGIAGTSAMRTAVAWTGAGGGPDPMNFTRAARWELYNPWSRIAELLSTHPMTVRRIQALQKLNGLWGVKNVFDFSKIKPGVYRRFWGDLLVLALPAICGAVGALSAGPILGSVGYALAGMLMGLGIGIIIQAFLVFPNGGKSTTVLDCLGEIDVSHVKPIPVVIQGTITGRVTPGFFWASDFILQDASGFITCVIHLPLGLQWLWGWCMGSSFIGKPATIHGWYRRFTAPYVEVDHFTTGMGERTHTHIKLWTVFVGFLVIGFGFLIAALA